jgi:hypothetical protein
MKLAKEGKDLDGAVEALYTFKTNFGDTLDNEEVNLLIQISKLDTNLYNDIALSSRDIGKKKTTVEENFTLLKSISKGSVQSLLNGIDVAKQCKYRIENDFFSSDRVELLIQIGNLKDTNRFLEIYDSMKNVGMGAAINTRGLELLYKLYSLQGDVSMKIDEYLKVNKWKSRKQPGDREYEVIRDIMKWHYATFDKMNREMSKGNSLSYEEKETPKENETPKEKENKEGSKKKAKKVTENSDERRKRELAREREYDGERDRDREDEKKVTPSRKGEAKAKGKKQVDPCPCAAYSK